MMSLTIGRFTQVSGSGPLGPLVKMFSCMKFKASFRQGQVGLTQILVIWSILEKSCVHSREHILVQS